MKNFNTKALEQRRQLSETLIRFARQEDGIVTVFACFMILMMLMVGGIGVDLMRNEMERTKIQNVSDRAVLAAADLDQTLDPQAVVEDYFAKSNMSDYLGTVTVDEGLNYRTVGIVSNNTTPTRFMRMVGVDSLPVPANTEASEKIAKVEISMVLDISGSMANDNKMANLRQAAGVFVDTVIRPETEDLISLSLVPYSEHVNAGPLLFNKLNTVQYHNYSHCLEMSDSDFNSTTLNRSKTYTQMQHFQWNYNGSQNLRDDTVCPRYEYERIIPLSQNANYIKGKINQFQPRAGTSIFLGMKWAVGLLDPDFRAITSQLISENVVDSTFNTRPANWNDVETLKTVILMTDGKNDRSNRIASRYYGYDSHYVHWDRYNFNWYVSRYVNYYDRPNWSWQKYDAATGDFLLDNICDAAKEQGIVIWAIGFEVDDHGANVMKQCASTTGHFFRVEGVDLTEAFRSIARQINQLRLTQ